MNLELNEQVALVTGASGGIGQAIVRCLVSKGAKVIAHYGKNSEEVEGLVEELGEEWVRAVRADLCSAEEIRQMFDQAEQIWGHLDLLVNNAGVSGSGLLMETDLEKLDRLLAVNFRAVVLCLQEGGKRLREGGAIVNVSSMLADYPLAGTGPYSATKAAVDVLSRTAAKEFAARRLSVNSLSPGATLPGMFGRSSEERKNDFIEKTPLKRLGKAEDVAEMVAFLFNPAGRWINGSVVKADGGFSA